MVSPLERIDALRDRISNSAHISDVDKDALLTFSKEMEFLDARYSDLRHIKLLQHCIVLAGDSQKYDPEDLPNVNLVDAFDDVDAVKEIGRWIKRNFENEETKRDYRVAVRMFGEHATPEEDIPEPIQKLSAGTPRSYNPMPDPAKMLWWDEHILPMVDEASHLRDKAGITVSWDAGTRSGEFCDLRVGDISDHKHGLKISVDGKRGERSVLLIPSVPYLRQWLNVHPAADDPSAPLWCKLESSENPRYRTKLDMLQKPAQKAGIKHTSVHFDRMRKSSASYLASQNVSQSFLENRYGWKRGSDVAARYIAVFSEASDREIARAYGVDVKDDEPDPIGPSTCPRCQHETPPNEPLCVWCGQALEHETVEQLEKDQRKVRTELLQIAKDNPELLEGLDRLERLIDFADANPKIMRDAQSFVEATSN